MEWLVAALTGALALVGYFWRIQSKETKLVTKELEKAQRVAVAATKTTGVLAERVANREEKIDEMVQYIATEIGVDGLADLLNDELLSDKEDKGGGSSGGLPN